jgi:DNA polymerase
MTWTDRQRRLLAAIGVRVWAPAADEAVALPVPEAGTIAAPAAIGAPAGVVASAARVAPVPAPRAAPAPAPAPVPVAVVPARPTTRPPAPTPAAPVERPPRPPVDDRIAQLDWAALQAAVATCTACALSESRRQTVFGVGHPQAHWMIVGEAPGEQEDAAGEPFVGPAGQLLDQMLRSVGLTRGESDAAHQVFIANTLKCRPPRNRNPEPDEMARCEPFLRRQIALVRPRLMLAMGRFAVKALLDSDEAIGKLRGRVHHHEGIPVIVTYHPAYLLRNLADKARAWDDLCLAAATLEASPPRSPDPH